MELEKLRVNDEVTASSHSNISTIQYIPSLTGQTGFQNLHVCPTVPSFSYICKVLCAFFSSVIFVFQRVLRQFPLFEF